MACPKQKAGTSVVGKVFEKQPLPTEAVGGHVRKLIGRFSYILKFSLPSWHPFSKCIANSIADSLITLTIIE